MGIGAATGYWLHTLKQRGVFDSCRSIVDVGPQDMSWPVEPMLRFVKAKFPDDERRREFEARALTPQRSYTPDAAASFYQLLGLDEYAAVDLVDPRADWKHNLNFEFDPPRRFDVVTDFGTLEHVFNIGEGFRTVHRLLKPGGVALHFLPTYGAYYHGLFNIHSVAYHSLALANKYEVLDLYYIHNGGRLCRQVETSMEGSMQDIRRDQPRLQNLRFFMDYFLSLALRRPATESYVAAAFRKTSDAPFVFPQQVNKYALLDP